MIDRRHVLGCALLVVLAACGNRGRVDDPVAGVDLPRQRTISRAEVGFRWPLSVGGGTVACAESGAILFRTLGVTYILSGSREGALEIEPLRLFEPSGPPSNPLKRMRQDQRMEAFQSMLRCDVRGRIDDTCRRSTLTRLGLSPDEWALIDVEGHERRWTPLTRELMSLEPLVVAGRALCTPASGR